MSMLRRIEGNRMPRPGETVRIYQHNHLLAEGTVVASDSHTVSIAGQGGIVDLDTSEMRRGLYDGTITVQRPVD